MSTVTSWILLIVSTTRCPFLVATLGMTDREQSVVVALPVSQQEPRKPVAKASLSCLPYMDALWFCYSPVFQMKQYYRDGVFDSCGGKWMDLFRCISLKTKPSAEVEAILEEREAAKGKDHIWNFRTQEEANDYWKQQFGHLHESAPADRTAN